MSNPSHKTVLGVTVEGRTVQAVVLRESGQGLEVARRLTRQRAGAFQGASTAAFADTADTPTTGDDFTIQFGDSGGGNELFMANEFAGMEGDAGGDGAALPPAETFDLELADLLDECHDAGFTDPDVAFAAAASDVTSVELRVPPKARKKGKAKADGEAAAPADVGREALLELLRQQHDAEVDEERVAFVPMTPTDDGLPRYLALLAKPNDAVAATLELLRERKHGRRPLARLLDAEVPLYLGLARRAGGADEGQTLLVRAGVEDTLVLFLRGGVLLHHESLRSITTYDAPETICSRVLLLQDEYGIGEVRRVLLLADEREEALVDSFQMFFHDAQVSALRAALPGTDDGAPGGSVAATAAALRLLEPEWFADVNLLPKKLLRQQIRLPFTWHVPVLGLLLFVTALFFTWRFFAQEREIAAQRNYVNEFPELVDADPRALQARIDSLQAVSAQYVRALDVLDSLLVGSDQWSRTLEKMSNEVSKVSGIWIEQWDPLPGRVRLAGNATERDRVVELAARLEGEVTTLTFSEIREWPVYSFELTVPVPRELPEAARYLREQYAAGQPASTSDAPADAPAAL